MLPACSSSPTHLRQLAKPDDTAAAQEPADPKSRPRQKPRDPAMWNSIERTASDIGQVVFVPAKTASLLPANLFVTTATLTWSKFQAPVRLWGLPSPSLNYTLHQSCRQPPWWWRMHRSSEPSSEECIPDPLQPTRAPLCPATTVNLSWESTVLLRIW